MVDFVVNIVQNRIHVRVFILPKSNGDFLKTVGGNLRPQFVYSLRYGVPFFQKSGLLADYNGEDVLLRKTETFNVLDKFRKEVIWK